MVRVVGTAFLALFALSTVGCYTLFKHPLVKTDRWERIVERRCQNCHTFDDIRAFHGMDLAASDASLPWWYRYWLNGRRIQMPINREPYYDSRNYFEPEPYPFDPGHSPPEKADAEQESSKKRPIRPSVEKPRRKD